MSAVSYLDPAEPQTGYAWRVPNGTDFNALWAEMDRKVGLCLGGLSPMLKSLYTPNAYVADAPDGLYGARYYFTDAGSPEIYFSGTFDQDLIDDAAASATEVSRDTTAGTMIVTVTDASPLGGGGVVDLDWSLKILRRVDGADTFVLRPDQRETTVADIRPIRHHRHAVAELVCQDMATFTVPESWDRYACFRIHNLSRVEMTVTVEDSTAGDHTIVVPKYGCRAFRRIPAGEVGGPSYDDSLTYFWAFKNARSRPRFALAGGALLPESSAAANNLSNLVNLLFQWGVALGWEQDPAVVYNQQSSFSTLFADPTDTATKLGDLIHHKGTVGAVSFSGTDVVLTRGTFTGVDSLVADLTALGFTITGTLSTDITATASGAYLWAPGANLLFLGNATHGGVAVSPGLRYVAPSPVVITSAITDSAGELPGPLSTTAVTETREWWSSIAAHEADDTLPDSLVTGTSYVEERASPVTTGWVLDTTIEDANTTIEDGYPDADTLTLSDWRLGPMGYEMTVTRSRRVTRCGSAGTSDWMQPFGLYDSIDADGVVTKSTVIRLTGKSAPDSSLVASGWPTVTAPGTFYPDLERAYGQAPYTGGTSDTETADFGSRELAHDPAKANRTILTREDNRLLHTATSTQFDSTTSPSYRIFDVGEELDLCDSVNAVAGRPTAYANMLRYCAGLPAIPDAFEPVDYKRLPFSAHLFNLLAWYVNSVTRCAPFYNFHDVFIGKLTGTAFTMFAPNIVGRGDSNVRPANQYADLSPSGYMDIVTELGLTPLDKTDEPEVDDPARAVMASPDSIDLTFTLDTIYDGQTWYESSVTAGQYYRAIDYHLVSTLDGSAPSATPVVGHDVDLSPDRDWIDVESVYALSVSLGLPFRWTAFGVALKWTQNENASDPSVIASSEYTKVLVESSPGNLLWVGNSTALPSDTSYSFTLSEPSNYYRFVPSTSAGETSWICNAAATIETDAAFWADSRAFRLNRRQRFKLSVVGHELTTTAVTATGGVTSIDTERTFDCIISNRPTYIRERDAHEEQALYRRRVSTSGTTDSTRLHLVPFAFTERTQDYEDGSLDYYDLNIRAEGGATTSINNWDGGLGIPWSRTDPDLDTTKSVAFASSTNHFRADTSESWVARLCEQVYVDLA